MKKKEDLAHIWVESGNIFSENICFAIIPFISNVLSYINAFFFIFLPNIQVDFYYNSFSSSLSGYMCCHWTFLIHQSSFKYLYLNILKQKMKIHLSKQPTQKSLFLLTNYLTMPNCFRELFAWTFHHVYFHSIVHFHGWQL